MAKKIDTTLEHFREEIDSIDNDILDLLAKRMDIVRQVGEYKHSSNARQSIIRPGREAEMIRRVVGKDIAKNNQQAAILAYMWRLIIAASINIEERAKIVALCTDQEREAYWLAREYFGAFTPMEEFPTSAEILQKIEDREATVAVLPLSDATSSRPWWSRIEDKPRNPGPRVFARLPFIKMAPSVKTPLVALGYVEPESTKEDASLWVLKTEERVQYPDLEAILHKSGILFEKHEHCRIIGNPTYHLYLIKVEGFVSEQDSAMKKAINGANKTLSTHGTPISAQYIGSYALPISLEHRGEDNTQESAA